MSDCDETANAEKPGRTIPDSALAESIIQEQGEQLRVIFATTLDGYWRIREDGKLLAVNDAYCAMSGYSRAELMTMSITDIEGNENIDQTSWHITSLMEKKSDIFTSKHRTKDGGFIDVEISASYWPSRNQIFAFIRDISARVQVTREMVDFNDNLERLVDMRPAQLWMALDTADTANRARIAFLTRMSHELYTPMNAIIGFSQLMEMDTRSPLNPVQGNRVQEILKAGRHLLGLIDEILEYSSMNADLRAVTIKPMASSPLILECIEMMKPSITLRNITILTDLDEGCTVAADRERFRHILLGLLSNVIQYNKLGRVRILCAKKKEGGVRITFRDPDREIHADLLGNIFEPFESAEPSTKSSESIGMVLTLCKQLIEEMGGAIGVESFEGVGTDFWIELPEAAEPQAQEKV